MRPPCVVRRGHRPSRTFGRHSAGRRTRGASVLAGVWRPTRAAVHTGPQPSRGFRDPCGPPYTRGIGPRRRSAGLPQAAAHAGPRSPAGVRQALRGPPYTRGLGPRGRSAAHAARRTRGTSVSRGHFAGRGTRGASALAAPAGVPQPPAAHAGHRSSQPPRASRRPPPRAGHRPPAGVPRPTQAAARAGPRSSQAPAGVPRPPAARRTHRASVPRGRSATHAGRRTRGASRRPRPPSPPAARFSRKPPCGIGPRMVYCT